MTDWSLRHTVADSNNKFRILTEQHQKLEALVLEIANVIGPSPFGGTSVLKKALENYRTEKANIVQYYAEEDEGDDVLMGETNLSEIDEDHDTGEC